MVKLSEFDNFGVEDMSGGDYEKKQAELQKKCKFVTSDECKNSKTSGESPTFYPGFLCSSEELGTICGPSEKTMLVDGRDEIFFVDTCGNLANIYDAGRQDDSEYWNKIVLLLHYMLL